MGMGSKSLIYNRIRCYLGLDSYSKTSVGRDSSRSAGDFVVAYNQFIFRSVMRKVFLFASAAIAALAMVSCNKEIEIQDQIAEGICPEGYYIEELMAEYPSDPATRTAFNETTGKFAWTEGDELAFHLSNGTYTSAPIDPATSKVKLYLPVGVTRDNYAVYPASAVDADHASKTDMKVTLPSTYDISGNLMTDYVPMPLIATNDATNKKLKFEHVGGLLQVNLNVPAGVKTATLSMGKTITGTFDLAAGSGNGVIEAGAVSDDALTFILSEEGLAAETSVKLLAPLPSGTYDKFQVAYDNGFAFTKDLSSKPWEFDRTQGKKVSIAEENFEDSTNYFWIEALEAGSTVFVTYNGDATIFPMEYSVDKKRTWNPYDSETAPTITLSKVGDRVYFRGLSNYSNPYPYTNYRTFNGTGKLKTGGDILLLHDYTNPVVTTNYAYRQLFYQNSALVDASELIMPEELQSAEFYMCFGECTSLEKAPKLPALDAVGSCYISMFNGCTSLTEAPELPFTKVGYWSCYGMFYNCTSLVKGPSAIILADDSYLGQKSFYGMFYNCVSLIDAPRMKLGNSSQSAKEACYRMFYNCTSLRSVSVIGPNGTIGDSGLRDMFYNCTSLDNIELSLPASNIGSRGYQDMFYNCTSLTNSLDVLPATTVGEMGYSGMFGYCTSLLHGPEIEATTLSRQSCIWMFEHCHSMTTAASILPATKLAMQCYSGMFANCWALAAAPVLPATTLASYCYGNYAQYYDGGRTGDSDTRYGGMFANCKALTVAPELPAIEVPTGGYYGMFHGCENLLKAPDLPAVTVNPDGYFRMFEDCVSLTEASINGDVFPYIGTAYRAPFERMFYGCSSLSKITLYGHPWDCLKPEGSSGSYYSDVTNNWMYGVPSEGIFIKPASLSEKYGSNRDIPSGWTVYNLEEVEAGN